MDVTSEAPWRAFARTVAPRRSQRAVLVRRTLVASDLAALLVAYGFTLAVAGPPTGGRGQFFGLVLVAVIAALFAFGISRGGLYVRDVRHPEHSTVAEVVPIFEAVTATFWLGYVVAIALGAHVDTVAMTTFWGTAVVLVPLSRAVTRSIIRQRAAYLQNTIIVGAGDVGQLIGRKLQQHPEFGIRLLGFVDSDPKAMRTDLDGFPVIGSVASIDETVRLHGVERAIVAFSNETHDELLRVVRALQAMDVQVDVVPRLFEAVGPAVDVHSVEGLALVGLPTAKLSRSALFVKRSFDLLVSGVLIVLLSPLLLWIALRIRRDSRGPILFRQKRLGQDQREFDMLKFRTMLAGTDDAPHREYIKQIMDTRVVPSPSNLYKLERRDVVTRAGVWLRRTSLDELPQLFNVFRGEMSLVGPRPCMRYETELFAPHHFDRFHVPAGMTGLWQVSARASSTFVEALDLDASYAHNWSFWLDLSLLARTPGALLRGKRATS